MMAFQIRNYFINRLIAHLVLLLSTDKVDICAIPPPPLSLRCVKCMCHNPSGVREKSNILIDKDMRTQIGSPQRNEAH